MANNKKKTNSQEKEGRYDEKYQKKGSKNSNANKSRVLDLKENTRRNAECTDDRAANDVSWYSKNPQLLKDAGSLSFANALGLQHEFNFTPNANGKTSATFPAAEDYSYEGQDAVPGIMAIDLIPCYGVSDNNVSAINVAARNIYSDIRHANSGAKVYDPVDLMLYLLSMDNAYTLWGWMVRLYGLAMTYNGKNRYYPRAIIEAMGVDFDDLIGNLAQYRTYVNTAAARLSSFYVPTVMPVFTRHQWLYRNVYLDSPEDKAQTIFFNPEGFLFYDEYSGAGRLEFKSMRDIRGIYNHGDAKLKISAINEVMSDMIDRLIESEDIGIMSGDILKAYGSGNTYAMQGIPETYAVYPVYSEEVLMQIHNLRVMGLSEEYNNSAFHITQDEQGNLIAQPSFNVPTVGYDANTFIDMYTGDATPEHVVVATRLNFNAVATGSFVKPTPMFGTDRNVDWYSYKITSCGTELPARMRIYNIYDNGANLQTRPAEVGSEMSIIAFDSDNLMVVESSGAMYYLTMAEYLQWISNFACFDWAPLVRSWDVSNYEGTHSVTAVGYINDLDNYAPLAPSTLHSLNDVALLSLFDVPTGK